MVDTCTITRITGAVTDPETGRRTETTAVVYLGKCRIQQEPPVRPGARREVGEASVVLVGYVLQLPVTGSEDVRVEDIVTIGTSVLDPALQDRVFRVASSAAKTHATARRLEITEVNS